MGMGEPSVPFVGVPAASPDAKNELEEAYSDADDTMDFT
jgi:hypothetical protein